MVNNPDLATNLQPRVGCNASCRGPDVFTSRKRRGGLGKQSTLRLYKSMGLDKRGNTDSMPSGRIIIFSPFRLPLGQSIYSNIN